MALENDASLSRGSALRTHSLALAAVIVAAGFLGSRVLGLLRSVIIAHTYGTQPELDAYFVAFRLPDLVFQLLAGATLAPAAAGAAAGLFAPSVHRGPGQALPADPAQGYAGRHCG